MCCAVRLPRKTIRKGAQASGSESSLHRNLIRQNVHPRWAKYWDTEVLANHHPLPRACPLPGEHDTDSTLIDFENSSILKLVNITPTKFYSKLNFLTIGWSLWDGSRMCNCYPKAVPTIDAAKQIHILYDITLCTIFVHPFRQTRTSAINYIGIVLPSRVLPSRFAWTVKLSLRKNTLMHIPSFMDPTLSLDQHISVATCDTCKHLKTPRKPRSY